MNVEKVVKKLQKGWHTLDQLGVKMIDIRAIKARGHMVNMRNHEGKRWFSIPVGQEMTSFFISGKSKKEKTYRWLEMSDLHAGSIQFDRKTLHQVLQRALDEGIEDVHLAGDLHDGIKIYSGHHLNIRYEDVEDQSDELAEILEQYPFRYIAITGNHDFSYEKQGCINPVALLEQKVPNFHFLKSYAADLIIGGVVKRMVHGASGRSYALSYPGQTYVRDLLSGQGEHVYVRGNKYRLRFIQFGHYHTYITYECAGIWISHSGNTQLPNDYCIRKGLIGNQGGRLVEATIVDEKVVEYKSTFVKAKRQGE